MLIEVEDFQLMNYEVEQGRLSEIGQLAVTPDVDGCGY